MSAPSVSFYLNREKVSIQYYAQDGRLQMSLRMTVDPAKFRAGKLPADQKAVLRRIESKIDIYESDSRQAGRTTRADDVRAMVLETLGLTPAPRRPQGTSFLEYFGSYLEDVEAGIVLNRGKKYSTSFIKIANVVGRLLPSLSIAKVPVDAITEAHLRDLAAELTKLEYAKNTVATYMDPVMSFLTGGRRAGRHKGPQLESRSFRVPREDVDHGVYLNSEEQAKILALELEGDAARLRDAFIFGCQVGMRHSDLCRLTPQHRTGDTIDIAARERGNIVNINTKKTGAAVWVPLNELARELWDSHAGVFNMPGATEFLFIIKDLGDAAHIDQQILFSRTEGGRRIERWVNKWELLGTHTMRRSFATNAFKAGVPAISIMKMTGHKSMANFMKYIRLSDEEHAQLTAAHPHFK